MEQDVLLPSVLFCFSDLTKLLVTTNYMNHKNHEITQTFHGIVMSDLKQTFPSSFDLYVNISPYLSKVTYNILKLISGRVSTLIVIRITWNSLEHWKRNATVTSAYIKSSKCFPVFLLTGKYFGCQYYLDFLWSIWQRLLLGGSPWLSMVPICEWCHCLCTEDWIRLHLWSKKQVPFCHPHFYSDLHFYT